MKIFVEGCDDDRVVMHKCDVRCCVNPDHLIVGSQRENLEDMAMKARSPRGLVHHNGRLSDSDVIAIRSAAGTHQSIADVFGVSRECVTQIRAGKRRKHI